MYVREFPPDVIYALLYNPQNNAKTPIKQIRTKISCDFNFDSYQSVCILHKLHQNFKKIKSNA
jgi:hypothetical protein